MTAELPRQLIDNMNSPTKLYTLLLVLIVAITFGHSPLMAQKEIDFAHDILPLLKSKCAECHTNGVFKGGLSLESRDSLLDSGAVEIGSASTSEILRRVVSQDADERMPPNGNRLEESQVQALTDWINSGLAWPDELSLVREGFERPLALRNTPEWLATDSGNAIDKILSRYFERQAVTYPRPLSDQEFIRRATLDLIGLLPTHNEVQTFSNNRSPDKHAELIDDLLARNKDYADHWLSFWNDLLRNDYAGTGYIDGGRKQITGWLYEALASNLAYDQFAKQLIAPTPESEGFIKGIKWRGKVNASQIEPLQFSQNVSQVFLGINMKCASCHDSFIDDWKLKDAYGLAAIAADQPLEIHRCDVPTGEFAESNFVFPSVGKIDHQLPRAERLERLATLLTSKSNGRFPRTIVNRLWERFAGRGLIHPVDVMANQAWSEELLDFLATDLVEHKYDLKHTMRLIASSRIYRSASTRLTEQETDDFVFKGLQRKRLSAEQFVDAVWRVTDSAPGSPDAKVVTGDLGISTGKWIWKPNAMQAQAGDSVTFKYTFTLDSLPEAAICISACDNSHVLFVNGKRVAKSSDWTSPVSTSINAQLRAGTNTVLVRGKNGGDTPNPAALYVEILTTGHDGSVQKVGSSKSWLWTQDKTDNQGNGNNVNWANAVELESAEAIYQQAQTSVAKLVGGFEANGSSMVRASLVKSNLLMRSLGRPNREQVVTTRPAELSTLQALDLSNGEQLASWLDHGAEYWLQRKEQHSWNIEQLISKIFTEVLSRSPSDEEFEILVGDQQLDKEIVEDILWSVVMLPGFQFVH